ncbi:alpha 1,2 mannosyltransferase [Mortierella alpina]|nr:alpha 1,2 mannosyltransferase [Mortierella alpina]
MRRYRPFSRATWTIYLLLLAFRLFSALSPGYIHPDEFFQSAEITAGNIFDLDVNIPWEYKPELPCSAITTGIPYLLLKTWIGADPGMIVDPDTDRFVSSRALFITQRLSFVLISLIIDWAVVRMARQIRRSPSIALLLVSSSYVTLAYHTHPFSNTVETVILALCAAVLSSIILDHDFSMAPAPPSPVSTDLASTVAPAGNQSSTSAEVYPRPTPMALSFLLGVLFAVGTFTRITFVIYGFPLGVMFLYINFKATFTKNRTIVAGASKFIATCLPLALGLATMSAFAVLIDSIYFHKLIIYSTSNDVRLSLRDILITHPKDWHQLSYKGSLTFTMWNNLRYNLDKKNLAEHGLHPRFFHLFLNFPVLFGNLALIAVVRLWQKFRAGEWSSQSRLVTALSYSGIFGVGVLSTMPHQEARFLTPLILPLVISLSGRIAKLGRKFWVRNSIMALVLGLFHQSGLVPAMDIVQQQALGFQDCYDLHVNAAHDNSNHRICLTHDEIRGKYHSADGRTYSTHVIFYKTYLPPQHLLGYNPRQAKSHGLDLRVSDWREKDRIGLLRDLGLSDQSQGQRSVRKTAAVNDTLLGPVQDQLKTGQLALLFRKAGPSHWQRTILIAPSTVDFTDQDFYETRKQISRHANFDHIQTILQDPMNSLQLNIFYL